MLGPPADVWGVGAVVYAAATGRRPFYGLDDDTRYPQLEAAAPPVRVYRRLPRALAEIVDACLDPDAGARPTPAELFDRFEELVAEPG